MGNAANVAIVGRERGLLCRYCGSRKFRVLYTRYGDGVIKRRRECQTCQRRISTWERTIG